MTRLTQDAFLSELTRMFQKAHASAALAGSVQLTWKAYSPAADAAARASSAKAKSSSSKKKPSAGAAAASAMEVDTPEVRAEDEPVCLLHARLKDKKISTIVAAKDVARFQRSFSALLTVQTSEHLLAKGETLESKKRKAAPAGGASAAASASAAAGSSSAASSSKKKQPAQKKAKVAPDASNPDAMSDVAPPAAAAAAAAAAPVVSRADRLAALAANKKPHISKQQRRDLRHAPNPHKELEKKSEKPAAAAVASSAPAGGSAKKAKGKQ